METEHPEVSLAKTSFWLWWVCRALGNFRELQGVELADCLVPAIEHMRK
jgi:hypothetical protein